MTCKDCINYFYCDDDYYKFCQKEPENVEQNCRFFKFKTVLDEIFEQFFLPFEKPKRR